SYEETSYLLQSPRNAERLRAAILELDAGRGKERKLVE
ncbi:MAG: prevent-host-death family protein/Antitoxin of toxin-antitoxin stability system, partial [Methylocystaceae bacterium]